MQRRATYTQVRAYVSEIHNLSQEAFIPLQFGPLEAQVDWGEASVLSEEGAAKVHLFVMTLPFSGARFVAAFPRQSQEFFLEGHERAFRFFGAVPRRIVYDNLKSAVTKVGRGRRRDRNAMFVDFSQRYLFESAFCNVARGNEKGHVENGVGLKEQSSRFVLNMPSAGAGKAICEFTRCSAGKVTRNCGRFPMEQRGGIACCWIRDNGALAERVLLVISEKEM